MRYVRFYCEESYCTSGMFTPPICGARHRKCGVLIAAYPGTYCTYRYLLYLQVLYRYLLYLQVLTVLTGTVQVLTVPTCTVQVLSDTG